MAQLTVILKPAVDLVTNLAIDGEPCALSALAVSNRQHFVAERLSYSAPAHGTRVLPAPRTPLSRLQCYADGAESVIDSDFQIAVEELNAVAVAEFVAFAMADSNCMATIRGCADAAQCVRDGQQCSGPGVEQQLPCCDANLVCASVFGSETFTCRSRASANAFAAEVLEC